MASPAKASALAEMVIVSEVWRVSPETVWTAETAGACVATVSGARTTVAELPAASVATALKA